MLHLLKTVPRPREGMLILVLLVVSSVGAVAQTDWSIEGTMPSYGEFNAPPACPLPPLPYSVIPSVPPISGCVPLLPFPPLSCRQGGTTFDNDGNVAYAPGIPMLFNTDGFTIDITDPSIPLILDSWVIPPGYALPGPITGMGYDSAADLIWITDGFMAAAIAAVPTPCGAPPPIVVPPFPIPGPGGAQTGLAWDPCTGTLWAGDCGGFITNWAIGGALLAVFPSGLPTISGATMNVTNGNVQVTDGVTVAEFTPGGVLAAPGAFYLSANPYPIPLWAAPVDGLGFSLRPVNYGTGCGSGGAAPTIVAGPTYPWAGNPAFSFSLTGATPGASALLIYGFAGPACPPLPIGCCAGAGLYIAPPFGGIIAVGVVPGAGTIPIAVPIPPPGGPCGLPIGVPVFLQFVDLLIAGGCEVSDALAFTIGSA